jgi:dephospho-CoA kinase
MLRIGITGGIGSGKSTVARIFGVLGIPVYYADVAAKQLMNEDPELKAQMIQHFGSNAYEDGKLNRSYISSLVFNNKEKLDLLNSIVHPATIRNSEDWMKQQSSSYVLKEAALIFESGSQQGLDYVIGVSAPAPLRIHRAMKRDGISRAEVTARMTRQIQETIKMRLCNFIIVNDEQTMLIPQVISLHNKLMELSKLKR